MVLLLLRPSSENSLAIDFCDADYDQLFFSWDVPIKHHSKLLIQLPV
jgi:hypothetical protein